MQATRTYDIDGVTFADTYDLGQGWFADMVEGHLIVRDDKNRIELDPDQVALLKRIFAENA